MKLIALTQRVSFFEQVNERRDQLDQAWSRLVMACGYVPVLLPNNPEGAGLIFENLNISGIILTGGNDLVKLGGDAPERDKVETMCIEYSVSKQLPLIGICRGMQMILDYFGAELTEVPEHVRVEHNIKLSSGNRRVNSYHRFGTKQLPDSLEALAVSDDLVIESVRHRKHMIYGIMWHPERANPFDILDIEFIKKIFG